MPVVFEDLDTGPEPSGRRVPRWLPVVGAAVAAGIVVAMVASRGSDVPVAAPSPSGVVSFVPTAARGVTPDDGEVVLLDQYAVPGVMSVSGRAGWRLDADGGSADVRRYTAYDLATGGVRSTVTFGVADRMPMATAAAEASRYVGELTAAGATGLSTVAVAFRDTTATDLSYTTAGGRYVMERLWLHDGIALFVQVSDVWAQSVATLFDDTVRYGAITP